MSKMLTLLFRAVSEAEKLVGYPTSLNSVRGLVDNDFANIAVSLCMQHHQNDSVRQSPPQPHLPHPCLGAPEEADRV